MRESIFSKYKDFVFRNWDTALLPKIAEMVAHAILFEERKTITHDFDPEWDSSGMLANHTESPDFPVSYQNLSDFLDEFTGESRATYSSGCGLYSCNYRDKAQEIFSDFLLSCRKEIFSLISPEEIQFLLSVCKKTEVGEVDSWDISELFEELDFFDDEVDFEIAFEKWVNDLSFKWIYKMGEPIARKTFLERELKREEEIKRITAERNQSERLFESVRKLYRLKYRSDLPQTIGKPGPYLHQINQLIQDFGKDDQELIFIYGPFSNSIRDEAQRKRSSKTD